MRTPKKKSMSKIKDRRAARQAKKTVHNPVTGKPFTKAEKRLFKKYGVDESGRLRSKYDTSNKINRLKRTEKRREVQMRRAETGNTFGNSMSKMFGSIFGGGQQEETYYPNEETYYPENEDGYGNEIADENDYDMYDDDEP